MRALYFTQYQGCSSLFFPGNSFLLFLSITSIRPYLVQILTYRSHAHRNFSNINHFPCLFAQSPGKKTLVKHSSIYLFGQTLDTLDSLDCGLNGN